MRIAVVLILSGSVLVSCSNDPGTPSAPRTEWIEEICDTVACELASLDAGLPVDAEDDRLGEYEETLRELSRWCRVGERQIADYAIAAFQARVTVGAPVGSLLSTLRSLPTRPGVPREKRDCSERFARLG